MSLIFPRWSNTAPRAVLGGLGMGLIAVVGIVTYYFTPEYWEVGYEPEQPVAFSHHIHVGQLGIDCRYCHTNVEESNHSNVPDTATCMACHTGAGDAGYLNASLWASHKENVHLTRVRQAYATGEPIPWARIHKVPDYAHFNHAVHVNAGISCYSCHGRIDTHEVARQVHSLSMAWCLECHREPEEFVVAASDLDPSKPRITALGEVSSLLARSDYAETAGAALVMERQLQPPQHCGACHY